MSFASFELALVVDGESALLEQVVDLVVPLDGEGIAQAEHGHVPRGVLHLGDGKAVGGDAEVLSERDAGVELAGLHPSGPVEDDVLHTDLVDEGHDVEGAEVTEVHSPRLVDFVPLVVRQNELVDAVVTGRPNGGCERIDVELHLERLEDLARKRRTRQLEDVGGRLLWLLHVDHHVLAEYALHLVQPLGLDAHLVDSQVLSDVGVKDRVYRSAAVGDDVGDVDRLELEGLRDDAAHEPGPLVDLDGALLLVEQGLLREPSRERRQKYVSLFLHLLIVNAQRVQGDHGHDLGPPRADEVGRRSHDDLLGLIFHVREHGVLFRERARRWD